MATVLILAGALLGVGRHMKIRAEINLVSSELEVLATALQQYYDDWDAFPFVTEMDTDGDGDIDGDDDPYSEFYLEIDLNKE